MIRKKIKGFDYIKELVLFVAVCLLLIFIFIKREEGPPPLYGPSLQVINNKDTTDSYQFVFLSDVQRGWGVFKPMMQEITKNGYVFAVIGGDIVHIGSKNEYHFFFRELADVRGQTPLFFVPGNHDVFDENIKYTLTSLNNI